MVKNYSNEVKNILVQFGNPTSFRKSCDSRYTFICLSLRKCIGKTFGDDKLNCPNKITVQLSNKIFLVGQEYYKYVYFKYLCNSIFELLKVFVDSVQRVHTIVGDDCHWVLNESPLMFKPNLIRTFSLQMLRIT